MASSPTSPASASDPGSVAQSAPSAWGSRSTPTILAPRAAIIRAVAAPMPEAAPVITATRPSRSMLRPIFPRRAPADLAIRRR
jgi:hypothetical protein